MNMTVLEKVTRDWARRQEGHLKHPHAARQPMMVRNDKRSERYIGTCEDRRMAKYGVPDECYFTREAEDNELSFAS